MTQNLRHNYKFSHKSHFLGNVLLVDENYPIIDHNQSLCQQQPPPDKQCFLLRSAIYIKNSNQIQNLAKKKKNNFLLLKVEA